MLAQRSALPASLKERVDSLRQLRNIAVHRPADLKPGQLNWGTLRDGGVAEPDELKTGQERRRLTRFTHHVSRRSQELDVIDHLFGIQHAMDQ